MDRIYQRLLNKGERYSYYVEWFCNETHMRMGFIHLKKAMSHITYLEGLGRWHSGVLKG